MSVSAQPPPASSPPLLNEKEKVDGKDEVFSPKVAPEIEETDDIYKKQPEGTAPGDPDYEPMKINLEDYSVDSDLIAQIPADASMEGSTWVAFGNTTGQGTKKTGRMWGCDPAVQNPGDKKYRTAAARARYDTIGETDGIKLFTDYEKIACVDAGKHRIDCGIIRPGDAFWSKEQKEWCHLIDWFHRTDELKPYFLTYMPQSRLFKLNDDERLNSIGPKRTTKLPNKWQIKDLRNLKRGNVVVVDGSHMRIGLNYPREWGFFCQPCSNTGVVQEAYGPFDWLFYWYEDLAVFTANTPGLLNAERDRLREEKREETTKKRREKTEQKFKVIHTKAMSEVIKIRGTTENVEQFSPRTSLLSGRARSDPARLGRRKKVGGSGQTTASESPASRSMDVDNEETVPVEHPAVEEEQEVPEPQVLTSPELNRSEDRSKREGYVAVTPKPSPRKSTIAFTPTSARLLFTKSDTHNSYISHNLKEELVEHKQAMDSALKIIKLARAIALYMDESLQEMDAVLKKREDKWDKKLKSFMEELQVYFGNALPTLVKDALSELIKDDRSEPMSEISESLVEKIRAIVVEQAAIAPKTNSREVTPQVATSNGTGRSAEQSDEDDDEGLEDSDFSDEEDSSSDSDDDSQTQSKAAPTSEDRNGGDSDTNNESHVAEQKQSKGAKRSHSGESGDKPIENRAPAAKRVRVVREEELSDTESLWSFLSTVDGRFNHPECEEFDPDERFYTTETFAKYINKFKEITGLDIETEKERMAVARLCGHNRYKLDKFRGQANELVRKFDKAKRHNDADPNINQLYDKPKYLPTKGPLSTNAAFRAGGGKAPKYPVIPTDPKAEVKVPKQRASRGKRGLSAIVGEFPNDAQAGINVKLAVDGELKSPNRYKHSKCLAWLPVGIEKEIIESAKQNVSAIAFVKHVALKLSRVLVNGRKCPHITGPQSFKNMCLRAGKLLKGKTGFTNQKTIMKTLPPLYVIIDRALEYRTLVAPVRSKGILSIVQYMGKLEYNRVYKREKKEETDRQVAHRQKVEAVQHLAVEPMKDAKKKKKSKHSKKTKSPESSPPLVPLALSTTGTETSEGPQVKTKEKGKGNRKGKD